VPIGYLTRVVEFTATHRVARADWSAEQNALEFGDAARDHPHRYQCRVSVKGPLDPAHGGVMSLATLDALLAEEITARLDGRHLNDSLPEFGPGRWVATGEALALYLWNRLTDRLPLGVALHAVRVQEGPDIYAEYLGEP
jgi:6-pyruvoyltetrahydropterin/6-carboxytetrahydropterin synthase